MQWHIGVRGIHSRRIFSWARWIWALDHPRKFFRRRHHRLRDAQKSFSQKCTNIAQKCTILLKKSLILLKNSLKCTFSEKKKKNLRPKPSHLAFTNSWRACDKFLPIINNSTCSAQHVTISWPSSIIQNVLASM